MQHYIRVHKDIFDTDLYQQPCPTRWLWYSLLFFADDDGFVRGNASTLARRSALTVPEVEKGLAYLLRHDPYADGAFIEDVGSGYKIAGFERFSDGSKHRKELARQRQARYRTRVKERLAQTTTDLQGV